MGQTADDLSQTETRDVTGDDPEEIREEIEQTRAEMTGTIDAIQERLSPDNIKEQAKDAVREATIGRAQTMVDDVTYTAREKGTTIWETIRENPLPAAMVAVGAGWLWKNRSQQRYDTRYERGIYAYGSSPRTTSSRMGMYSSPYGDWDRGSYGRQGYERTGYMDTGRGQTEDGGMQERVGEMAGSVQERAGQAVDQVSQFGSQAADYGSQTVNRMSELSGEGMHAMRNRYDQMIMESPLALGLIALGVGAAVGLVVPSTEREDQLMGEAKDQFVDRAGAMAQETLGKVQQVASQTGDAMQQAVQEQTSTTS